jgi:hypothetical protein
MNPLRQRIESLSGLSRAYRSVFNTPDGEKVLQHICKQGFVFTTSMNTNGLTEFNEGRRSLALEILAMLKRDEAAMIEMLETYHEENQ